jgi:hypothetical protein
MTVQLTRTGVAGEHESAAAALRRIGHVAGVLAIAVVVFASLYFFVLYVASE